MIIEKTEFNGLLLIKPIVHQDERGYFFESFRDDYLKKIGLSVKFCQDNQTKSKKGTLRGLHYQLKLEDHSIEYHIHLQDGIFLYTCIEK